MSTLVSNIALADSRLELRVQSLERASKARSHLQSEMSVQLTELQKEIKDLRGILEEHEYKLQQIQDRQRDLYREMEARFSSQVPSALENQSKSFDGMTASQHNATADSSTTAMNQNTEFSKGERVEFEAVFKMVRGKRYAQALESFEVFLHKYPSGKYSDNACFWIGQIYFVQGEFEKAEQQFNLLKKQYPRSSKLPSAMLKLAQIKVRQEKWDDAKAIYREVLSNYTGAQQQLARKGLQDLKRAGH